VWAGELKRVSVEVEMKRIMKRAALALGVALGSAGLVAGCAGDDATARDGDASATALQQAPRARNRNLSTSGLAEAFDVNGDGQDDQRYYRAGGQLIRVERDINFDGRADVFEHYEGGQEVEEELDLDFDGRVDVVKMMRDGVVEKRQYAVAFQERMVLVSWYDGNGALVRIERDTNDDLRIDTWEHYNPGASRPHRIEVDYNGDERPDETIMVDETVEGG
jgi:hypothetical protein